MTKSNDDCPVKLTVILTICLGETNIHFFWNDLRVKGKGKTRGKGEVQDDWERSGQNRKKKVKKGKALNGTRIKHTHPHTPAAETFPLTFSFVVFEGGNDNEEDI